MSKYGQIQNLPVSGTSLETKAASLARSLIDSGDAMGIQVHVIQKGKPVLNLSAGVMGVFDPRPVLEDSLFPVFSCTKAITSVMLHKLVQEGLLNYNDRVETHWPEFTSRITNDKDKTRKSLITVSHLLSHRSGLYDAGNSMLQEDPMAIANWDQMISVMENAVPSHDPGEKMVYHALSFGWLVGGLIEKVSKKKFETVFKEFKDAVRLGDHGYVGIPPGLEARLSAVHFEVKELFSHLESLPDQQLNLRDAKELQGRTQSSLTSMKINPMASNPSFFNQLKIRRAVIPAASGNFSARGLAQVYSHLVDCHSSSSLTQYVNAETVAMMRTLPEGGDSFGLGFRVYSFEDKGSTRDSGFGHAGLGGSIALCDLSHQVSFAIVVNKLSLLKPVATQSFVRLICEELQLGNLVQLTERSVDMSPLNA